MFSGSNAILPPGARKPTTAADDDWHLFATAQTAADFCRAWLGLLSGQLNGVRASVILLESAEAATYLPIAVWPENAGDLSRLGGVAQRALADARGVVDRDADAPDAATRIGYPVQGAQRVLGAVALEVGLARPDEVDAILRQLHWSIGWLSDLLHRRELEDAEARADRIGTVMEAVATALRGESLQQTLFEVTNQVARQLECSRVAIGLVHGETVRVAALSDTAWFEKNSALIKRYAAAMEECVDDRAPIEHNTGETDAAAPPSSVRSAHDLLAREVTAASILSYPLVLGTECIGVMTIVPAAAERVGPDAIAWLHAFTGLLSAIIDQKRRAERGYWGHARDDLRALLGRLFGPRHLVWKFGSAVSLAAVTLLTAVQIDYRVSAKTVIEGEIQRVVAAPFDGFIAASFVRAGDTVREGEVLCELDDRDLKVEQARWTSEREQHDKKLREAMANRDLAAIQIIGAQLRQANAQLALTTQRIDKASIVAPFDGIVVSGDLSQLIGSPVDLGKKLFEIAPLTSFRVILQVDERDVRHVETGQKGKLVIAGIAGDAIAFTVVKVTPVATAQDGRNFFRVEARLQQAPRHLRPGMEGIGKISVGDRRLWWILTHTFTDWLRLQLWSWMP